jgi:putative transposase
LLQRAPEWRRFLTRVICKEDLSPLRAHDHTGRPLGDEAFLASLEKNVRRVLRRQKPKPKGKPVV